MGDRVTILKTHSGLVETKDSEIEKPIWRRPGFEGIRTMKEMERALASALRAAREGKRLTRQEFAQLLGLSWQVYGRYERAFSKMHVTRFIHVCEVLGLDPIKWLYTAAPHLFGGDVDEARDRAALLEEIFKMPIGDLRALLRIKRTLSAAAALASPSHPVTG
ncbi:helix-turn-helix domain-containing protein [Sinorhizobium fredii]|uniref:helix-turn-helix domain-containing protein n=1 Tax=Rhizobium fredii TaxID=380 RepID=UPI003511A67A